MASEFIAHSTYKTDHRTPARFIWSHVRRHPLPALGVLFGAFFNAVFASSVPALAGEALNALDQGVADALAVALSVALGIVAIQAIRAVVQFARNFSSETFAQRIERDVRDELYGSLLGKSMTFHDMQPVGEIMARVTNDVREMNFMMNPGFNLVIGSSMFLLMPVLASPLIHPQLILVPLIFVLIHARVQYRLVTSIHPIAEEVRANFGRMNARLAEALEGVQVVKGAAQEDAEIARFNKLADAVRDRYIEQGDIEARYLSNLLLPLVFVAALVHATLLFQSGEINIGDIVSFIGQMYLFSFPVFTSLFSLSRIASGYASAGRILNIITTKTDLDQNPDGHGSTLKGEITFENVNFTYHTGEKQILHDISFTVKPGQTVAIVGQTGSGKSTITKLINRTYDTDSGRVLVDGIDVRDWSLEALRSQISIIEQDIFLFSRSITDNIGFGTPETDFNSIQESAKKAQAHEFIMDFPEGYDTVIGQRGVTLSGGQRQRLSLARAFETDPPVLILDDSTSAIDSATEDKIQRAIWAATENRTTILITHRLSQIRWADHIVVLRQGRVVAQGGHEELLKSSESYRRIFARYDEPVSSSDSVQTESIEK